MVGSREKDGLGERTHMVVGIRSGQLEGLSKAEFQHRDDNKTSQIPTYKQSILHHPITNLTKIKHITYIVKKAPITKAAKAVSPPTQKRLSHCSTVPTPTWDSLSVRYRPRAMSTGTSSQPSETTTGQVCCRIPLQRYRLANTTSPSWAALPTETHLACATTAAALGGTPSTATPFAPNPISAHTWQLPTCIPLSMFPTPTRQNDGVPARVGRPLLYSI